LGLSECGTSCRLVRRSLSFIRFAVSWCPNVATCTPLTVYLMSLQRHRRPRHQHAGA
jgi:hypothetical protein